jgi:hypothetical protein
LVAAGGAALYYLALPDHPGPENSSPPPEGIGLIFGGLIGCMVGVAGLAVLQRSVRRTAASFLLALGVATGSWLVFGSGTLGDRVGDCIFGAIMLGVAALGGIAAGQLLLMRRRR